MYYDDWELDEELKKKQILIGLQIYKTMKANIIIVLSNLHLSQ